VGWLASAGDATLHYRVRFSPDGGATWTVLALDTTLAHVDVAAGLLAGADKPVLEVQASDGVRVAVQTIALPGTSAPR
jgi:hypothetical protein